ncbi:MAG: hypothetical protein OEY16_04120 [Alphaproteobacteria bacterium]|nr:hypothetical protein [Alphaproteobacteria bacterium]
MERINTPYTGPRMPCTRGASFVLAATLLLAACGESAVDEFGIPPAQSMDAPDYDFSEFGPSKVSGIILDGKAYLFADEAAYIASVDGAGPPIALIYVSVYGEGEVFGRGPSSFAYIPGWDTISKAGHQALYDGASLGPGLHTVEIGEQQLFAVQTYSQNYKLSGGWSNSTVTVQATFEEGVAYMATTIGKGGGFMGIIVRSECNDYESLEAGARGKCYDNGLIVGASDPSYVGMRKGGL